MTTYYVDYVNGNDANNGLGPDASHASNKPWKTLGKLLGASGFASGDTAYLSPAGPFRETVTVAMTSATVETKVIGDVANAQGFKTSGGVLVAPGEVQWTAYTTNDTTAPSGSSLLTLSARDFLTFQNMTFVAGTSSLITGGTDATNITFTDCAFIGRPGSATTAISGTASFGTALNWTFERCRILCTGGSAMSFTATTAGAGADFDMNVQVTNSLIMSIGAAGASIAINVAASGSLSSKGNGVHVKNSLIAGSPCISSNSANLSNTVANLVYNNVLLGGLTANASGGLITEDYNRVIGSRTSVSTGAHSVDNASHAQLFHFGQELYWGGNLRPFGMPTSGSPLLGFGGNSPTTVDILNNPRPAGGASASTAVGAFERSNTFARDTSTVRTGSNAISITGPGFQDFALPVDATSTTCTVYVRWDATYAGTKPAMQVLNGSEAGVSDATATATGSSGSWEQLSLNFTPTSKGVVTIRFLSSDTNGGGKMFVDDFAVT